MRCNCTYRTVPIKIHVHRRRRKPFTFTIIMANEKDKRKLIWQSKGTQLMKINKNTKCLNKIPPKRSIPERNKTREIGLHYLCR